MSNNVNLYLTTAERQRIERLMDVLEAQGVDLRNEKHKDSRSISKLLRWLVAQEEQRHNPARP